jgi:hypothetical protein
MSVQRSIWARYKYHVIANASHFNINIMDKLTHEAFHSVNEDYWGNHTQYMKEIKATVEQNGNLGRCGQNCNRNVKPASGMRPVKVRTAVNTAVTTRD